MEFKDIKGKIFISIENHNDEELIFKTESEKYMMHHDQDCCESVWIEDICGDLEDLLNTPILQAEEVSNNVDKPPEDCGGESSYTWTFYKLSTIKGSVTIRWFGESNGYYSESVSFERIGDYDDGEKV